MIKLNVPYRYKRDNFISDIVFLEYNNYIYTYMVLKDHSIYDANINVVSQWVEYMKLMTDEEKLELL